MASRVEQARGFHTGLILAPQVAAGMGEEQEAERILGSVETIICHPPEHPRADHHTAAAFLPCAESRCSPRSQ